MLVESKFSTFFIYIPSKFPLYINNKTMNSFIKSTNIRIENEEDNFKSYKNDNYYILKEAFERNLQYFTSSTIKISYIYKNLILLINRHNEVEKFDLETIIPYDNIFWVIDLENFYVKVDTIDAEIKNITSNINLNLYEKFLLNRNEVVKYLQEKLGEINNFSKNLLPYNNFIDRKNKMLDKITTEKNKSVKDNYERLYKEKISKMEDLYMLELYRWDNFFTIINDIKDQ